MKTCYFWATPSGPINLMKAEDMPVYPRNCYGKPYCCPGERCKQLAYKEVLEAAKKSSVPIQDQHKALDFMWRNDPNMHNPISFGDWKHAILKPDTIYGPFSLRYEIRGACNSDSCSTDGMCSTACRQPIQVAILYDDTPEKVPQEVSITVNKSTIPKNAKLIEAYETEHRIIVMFSPGDEIPEDHNCDEMGCGSLSHVKYTLTKPDRITRKQ